MKSILLSVKYKIKKGSKYSRKIRNKNLVPGIIYGKKKKNIMFYIKHNIIYNTIKKNQLKYKKIQDITLKLKFKDKIIKSNIKEIQKHPFKNKILHIDLMYK